MMCIKIKISFKFDIVVDIDINRDMAEKLRT